jgi:outer membrane receptor protein involved in Fe transport
MANMSITGNNVYKSLGFTVSAKYQSSYYWQSFLVNGTVPSIFNMNAALYYSFIKTSIDVKLGASNIFNRYYYSILGGPQIGGLYYTTITYKLK